MVAKFLLSPAKTTADCFKYRNKIDLDAAVERSLIRFATNQARASRVVPWGETQRDFFSIATS